MIGRDPRRSRGAIVPLAIFAVVLASHVLSKIQTPFDSKWSIHTAMSILREGNTDLDEYEQLPQGKEDYTLRMVDGRAYTVYPIGVSLFAIPFVAVADVYCRIERGQSYFELLSQGGAPHMEEFVASFAVALTAVLVFLIAQRRLKSLAKSLLLVFIFAFCTSAWSTGSRALWQHGPSMLALALALYLIILAEERPKLVQYAGLVLAFSYVIRPTNSIPILALSLVVLLRQRRYFLRFLLWAMVVAAPFLVFNYSVYGAALPWYYRPTSWSSGSPHFLEALVGNWISPARGLLIFSPVLAFSALGIGIKLKEKRFNALDLSLLVIIILHWLTISYPWQWWAGHSFGPRLFSDLTPFFVYFLIPVLQRFGHPFKARTAVLASIFLCLTAVSFCVHFRGANHKVVWKWNAEPNNIDQHPERLWDWKDPQFLRFD